MVHCRCTRSSILSKGQGRSWERNVKRSAFWQRAFPRNRYTSAFRRNLFIFQIIYASVLLKVKTRSWSYTTRDNLFLTKVLANFMQDERRVCVCHFIIHLIRGTPVIKIGYGPEGKIKCSQQCQWSILIMLNKIAQRLLKMFHGLSKIIENVSWPILLYVHVGQVFWLTNLLTRVLQLNNE